MVRKEINKMIVAVFIIGSVLFSGCQVKSDSGKSTDSSIPGSSVCSDNILQTVSESDFQWPDGKKMGLSLTFDDARLSQIDNGIPLFDKYGVKATFYVLPGNMMKRIDGWKKAVKNGHEVGNHSLRHPCSGNFPFSRKNPLEDYSLQKMRTELDSANRFILYQLDVSPVSFAYPCGQTFIGRGGSVKSYVPIVASMFESGRGWLNGRPNNPAFCDMAQLTGVELDGLSVKEAMELIESAKSKGQWLILAGHETGNGAERQTSLLSTLEAICRYATDPANEVWIDNVHNIATYVMEIRGEASCAGLPCQLVPPLIDVCKIGYKK